MERQRFLEPVKALREQGETIRAIAEELGCVEVACTGHHRLLRGSILQAR